MKVIFLDVDGVLNTERYLIEQYNQTGKPHSTYHSEFDPICMQNLKEFIEETGAYIVVSSTWRLGNHDTDEGWKVLMDRLTNIGADVVGYTKDLSREYGTFCCRGREIQRWLDDNDNLNIESFVILDDDSDMFHLMPKLAKCSFKDGFTEEVKNKALEILEVFN